MREKFILSSFLIFVLLVGFPSSVSDFDAFAQNIQDNAAESEDDLIVKQEENNDEIEIEVVIKGKIAEIKIKINDQVEEFILEDTNENNIIQFLIDKTQLNEEEIKEIWQFEIEEERKEKIEEQTEDKEIKPDKQSKEAQKDIASAEREITKAENKISIAKEKLKVTTLSEELIEQAKNILDQAKEKFELQLFEEAEELAEEAKDLASESRMKFLGKSTFDFEDKDTKLKSKRDEINQKYLEKSRKLEEKQRELREKMDTKLRELALKADERVTAESSELKQKFLTKSDEIRERLLEKTSKLESRTAKILEKIEQGEYFGPNLGQRDVVNEYELIFDDVVATSIGTSETSTMKGSLFLSTNGIGSQSLKFKVDKCDVTINEIPYSCGFGKARAVSSGSSGEKDSLVIIAFLEDGIINEDHITLKLFLDSSIPIIEINDKTIDILSPQSKLSHLWFLEGSANLKKIGTIDVPVEDEPRDLTVELEESIGIKTEQK